MKNIIYEDSYLSYFAVNIYIYIYIYLIMCAYVHNVLYFWKFIMFIIEAVSKEKLTTHFCLRAIILKKT